MKKLLRVLVPLILVVVLFAFTAWYFAVYDREFTRDLLLNSARSCESGGYHKVATWLYDLAYYQSGSEDDIAIELAGQYVASGNLTKAEYTLSKAIANKPTASLYAELCRLYVRQDKLIDAVAILDTVSDPQIKAELDALRPAAPSISPEPPEDVINQIIDVALFSQAGTVYASSDGSYPTIEDGPCTAPISLNEGETVIWALTVGQDQLVSPLVTYSYTVGGIIQSVEFEDPAIEEAIRQLLGLDAQTTIYTNDLWDIREFSVPYEATTYSDLAKLRYLQVLIAENATAEELSHISSLRELTQIHLYNCQLSKELLTSIAAMPYLDQLTLRSCGLTSITELTGALDLEYLDLSDNTLRNITPLSGMTHLKELYLSENALTDLTAISGLTELEILNVNYNSLYAVEPICNLHNLKELYISHNKLYSLGNIQKLSSLTHFSATHNGLNDVRNLAGCTQLVELDISNNSIADITMLSTLTGLMRFDFSNNMVTALPAFPKEHPLVTIDGSHNLLISIEELAELPALNNVLLDYNPDLVDVSPLDTCPVLIQLNAYGTKVTDVEFLLDKSIIVNYNPVLDESAE